MKPADSPEPKTCSNNQLLLKSDQLGVNTVFGKLDSRKIQPLKISKEHFMFLDEVLDDDDDKTPEYPLKEGHKFFIPQMSALNDQIQSSHLFSDVSTRLPTHSENGCEMSESSGKEIKGTSSPKSNKPYNASRNSKHKHRIKQTNNPAPTRSGRLRRKRSKKIILQDHSVGDIHEPRTETQNEKKIHKSTKTRFHAYFHDGNLENRQDTQEPSQSLLLHEDDGVVYDHQEHTASPVCRVSEDVNNNKNCDSENNIVTRDKKSFPDFQPENSKTNKVSNIRVEDLGSNESSTDMTTRLSVDENHAKDESHSSLPAVNLITLTDISRTKNTNTGEHTINCDPSNKSHLAELHLEEIPENVLVSSLSSRENVSCKSQSICDTEIICSLPCSSQEKHVSGMHTSFTKAVVIEDISDYQQSHICESMHKAVLQPSRETHSPTQSQKCIISENLSLLRETVECKSCGDLKNMENDNWKSGLFQTSGFNNSTAPRNLSETPKDCKNKFFHSHKKDHCGTDTLVLHSEQFPEPSPYKHCSSGPYKNDKAEHVQDESECQDHRTRIRRVNKNQVIDKSSTKPSNMVVLTQNDLHQIPKRFAKFQSSQKYQPNTENSIALFNLEQKNLCSCTTNVKNITPAMCLTSGVEQFDKMLVRRGSDTHKVKSADCPFTPLSTHIHMAQAHGFDLKLKQKSVPISYNSYSSEDEWVDSVLPSQNKNISSTDNERYCGQNTEARTLNVFSPLQEKSFHIVNSNSIMFEQSKSSKTVSCHQRYPTVDYNGSKLHSDFRDGPTVSQALEINPTTFLTNNSKDQAVSPYQIHTPVQETWKKTSPGFHFPTNKTCNNVQQTSQGHVTTQNILITRPHFDPPWINKPTIQPFAAKVGTISANDFSMNVESHVSDTLQKSSCCNTTSAPPLIHPSSHRSQLIPNNYSPQKYSQMCTESLNIFNHMHVNKVIQQNVEPRKRMKHPSWVRVHNIQSNRIRNPVRNSQMPGCHLTVMSQAERLPLSLQSEKSGHNQAYECTVNEHLHSKDVCTSTGEDYSTLVCGIPTKVCMPGSQSFISTRIPQGLQTNETSVGGDLPYEPLDLSRRPATDVNTTDFEMFTERSICNNPLNTFMHLNVQEMPTVESDSCFVEPHSQSPLTGAYCQSAQHFQNNNTSRMLAHQNEKPNTFPGSAPRKVQTFVATVNRHQIQSCDATFQRNITLEHRDSIHHMKSALKAQVTAACDKNEHSLSYRPMLSSSDQNIQEHLPHADVTLSIEAQDRISQASDVAKTCSSGFPAQAPNWPGRISSGGSHSLKVLPATFSISRITKLSSRNPDEHSSSPDAAASSCSKIQERRGTTLSDDSAMSCSSRYSSNDSAIGNFSSRVIPLPIKDFFTRSPKENTYSSLLMAKIASKSKKQMQTDASHISLNHNDSSTFEIGNNLQKNLVIDLTEADDHCDVISVSSNDEDSRLDFFDATWRDRVSTPASLTAYTSVGEMPLTHSSRTNIAAAGYSSEAENLYATEKIHSNPANDHDCDRISHSASSVCTEQPCLLSVNMEVSAVSHNTERIEVQQEPNFMELREKEVLNDMSSDQKEVQPDNIQAVQPHRFSHCMPSVCHSCDTEKSVISHENKIIHNRLPSPAINDIGTANKEASTKLTAIKSGQKLEELSSRILMASKYASKIQQFHTMNSEEVNQPNVSTGVSIHDNSTQRAAATLLELSKNPLYNNYKVVPETSEDYQEKVYQIHPTLEVSNTVKELQEQNCSGNSHRAPDTSEISHKSGARTGRRVGRPPKDRYSMSNSSYSPETASVVSDSGISASSNTSFNPSVSTPMINLSTSNTVSPSQICNTFHISGRTPHDLDKPIHQTHLVGTTSSLAPLKNSHLLVDNDLRTNHQILPCDAVNEVNNKCSPTAINTSVQHANILSLVQEQQCKILVQRGMCPEKTLQTNSAVIEIHNSNPDTAIKVAVINARIPSSNVGSSDANITYPENFQCQKANIRTLLDAHGKDSVGNISVNEYTTSPTNVVSTSACSVSSSATAATVLISCVPSISPRFSPFSFSSPVRRVLPDAGQCLLQPNVVSNASGKNMSNLQSPLLKKIATNTANPKLTRQHCKINPQDKIFVINGPSTEMPREARRLISDLRTRAQHKSHHVVPKEADSNPPNLTFVSNQGLKTAKAGKKRKKTGRGRKKNTKKQKSFHQNVNVNLHELNLSQAVSGVTLHDDKLAGPTQKCPDNEDQTLIIRNRRDSSGRRDVPSKSPASSVNMHRSTKSSSVPFRWDHSRMQNTINRSEVSEDEFEKEKAVTSLLATMMHKKFKEPTH